MIDMAQFYSSNGPERVGFLLKDGKVVEVENIASDPLQAFQVSADDLLKYEGKAAATWHTHPGATRNLSVADYHTFLAWPELEHYIIGSNGVRHYQVRDGEVYYAS